MTEETRISRLTEAMLQITLLGGLAERTRIDTNLEVIDATGGIAGAAYIIIKDQEGYNVPAVRLSGVPYTNGDLVNVLYVEGTEPVAFQQGSGSVNPEQGKVSKIWQPDLSDVVAEANNSDLDLLLHGNLDFDNDAADHSITAAGTSDLLFTTAGGTITFDDSGDLSIPGTLTIPSDLIHGGDPDTKLSFADDQGSLTVGNVLMLRATETTQDVFEINPGNADVDTRVGATSAANALFVQGSDGFVGIGTNTPANQLDIEGPGFELMAMARSSSGGAGFRMANTLSALNVGLGAGATPLFFAGAPGGADNFFGVTSDEYRVQSGMKIGWSSSNTDAATVAADTWFTRLSAGAISTPGALVIGSPTGGSKGNGTINTAGDIYKNNSAFVNPDFSLEHYFTGKVERFKANPGAAEYGGLLPLAKLRDYLRGNLHLPGRTDKPMGVFERADLAQQWIEELALYITELHQRVERLEAKLNA